MGTRDQRAITSKVRESGAYFAVDFLSAVECTADICSRGARTTYAAHGRLVAGCRPSLSRTAACARPYGHRLHLTEFFFAVHPHARHPSWPLPFAFFAAATSNLGHAATMPNADVCGRGCAL